MNNKVKFSSNFIKIFLWELKVYIFWLCVLLCMIIIYDIIMYFLKFKILESTLSQMLFCIFFLLASPIIAFFETYQKGDYFIIFYQKIFYIECKKMSYKEDIKYENIKSIEIKKELFRYAIILDLKNKKIRIPSFYFKLKDFLKIYKIISRKSINANKVIK